MHESSSQMRKSQEHLRDFFFSRKAETETLQCIFHKHFLFFFNLLTSSFVIISRVNLICETNNNWHLSLHPFYTMSSFISYFAQSV